MLDLFRRERRRGRDDGPRIDFFTEYEALPDVVPVEPGSRAMPTWWKNTPAAIPGADPHLHPGTVKVCPAFPDLYGTAYVLKLWCDVVFDYNGGKPRAKTSAPDLFNLSFHGSGQFLAHAPQAAQRSVVAVLKLDSPWYVRTSPGYSVLQLPLFYEFDPRFTLMPGVIRSDVHHFINQQLMIHARESFVLERGTPLAMYIPFRRERFAFSAKEATEELRRAFKKCALEIETKFKRGYRKNTG
jgi:hypothetical protein